MRSSSRRTAPSKAINVRLPRVFAVMYLDWRGEWRLPLLNGIASAPLLREDGTIFCAQGYDAPSGMWLENVPDLADAIPDHPTRGQAQAGLYLLRETFRTFCSQMPRVTLIPRRA